MSDWSEFLSCNRGILIAPAGHGKTTAIADCLSQCPENSCQLVLTHTHAGIAALRTKFRMKNISPERFQLETITSFAQKYVLSFYGSSALPLVEDKHYFDDAVEKCCKLMASPTVQAVVKSSYDGVFVDEYQDCTIRQHDMIMSLAKDLPLHLLGDPLQGIFSFDKKPLIDFDINLREFREFNLLPHPWRWENTNAELGKEILRLRNLLISGNDVSLESKSQAGFIVEPYPSNINEFSFIGRIIRNHDSNNGLLIICPSYIETNQYGRPVMKGTLTDRISLKQRVDYMNRFTVIDAIDDEEYYNCAKEIDTFLEKCIKGRRIKRKANLYNLSVNLYMGKTELNKWIARNRDCFIKKKTDIESKASSRLSKVFSSYENDLTLNNLKSVFETVSALPKMKIYHLSLFETVMRSFDIAINNNTSLYEAMKIYKSRLRHQGRKLKGHCIGTTLLTKGLEFDTVIILNADKFEDAKNFYVAISRACRKLVILTHSSKLSFAAQDQDQQQPEELTLFD